MFILVTRGLPGMKIERTWVEYHSAYWREMVQNDWHTVMVNRDGWALMLREVSAEFSLKPISGPSFTAGQPAPMKDYEPPHPDKPF